MFPIAAVLGEAPPLKIVDVGALSLGAEKDPYYRLTQALPCTVIGFEPVAEECERLNREAKPGCRYFPHAVGDGSEQVFHECNVPMTSSLLEPNDALLGLFHELQDVTRVVRRTPMKTVRLDDVPEARDADYLKLDVQGGELMVLKGAIESLRSVLVLHTEVEFLPMYRNQPLFADIDAFLRGQGFVLHKISGTKGASFRIPGVDVELSGTVNQMLWGEAVFVRDFTRLAALAPAALRKYAAIAHENYGARDLAALLLAAHDGVAGTAFADDYLGRLFEEGE